MTRKRAVVTPPLFSPGDMAKFVTEAVHQVVASFLCEESPDSDRIPGPGESSGKRMFLMLSVYVIGAPDVVTAIAALQHSIDTNFFSIVEPGGMEMLVWKMEKVESCFKPDKIPCGTTINILLVDGAYIVFSKGGK